VVICLERGADLHTAQRMPLPLSVSCFSKIQIGFAFMVPAHSGSPGQRAVKRVCACVCMYVCARLSALEHRRAVRKFGAQPLDNPGAWPCSSCSRVCNSRIGLYTRERTHRRQEAIRRSDGAVHVGVCMYVCMYRDRGQVDVVAVLRHDAEQRCRRRVHADDRLQFSRSLATACRLH